MYYRCKINPGIRILLNLLILATASGCPGQMDNSAYTGKEDTGKKTKKYDKGITTGGYPDQSTGSGPYYDIGVHPDYYVNPNIDQGIIYYPDAMTYLPDAQKLGQYGSKCNDNNRCDSSQGLICVSVESGAQWGFCTKSCTNSGNFCFGDITRTNELAAGCLWAVTIDSKEVWICSYLCQLVVQSVTYTWPCPTDLHCSSTVSPYGKRECIP